MRLRGIIDQTLVNGPGKRSTVWVQGCTVGCPSCVNLETWDPKGGAEYSIEKIFLQLKENVKCHQLDGLSVSGGEPLEQLSELHTLLRMVKENLPELDILVYSGRLITDVKNYDILNYIDIFVDGPYIEAQRNLDLLWRGSDNQKVYLLNEKIRTKMRDYYNLLDESGSLIEGETGAELIIDENGLIQLTGFSDFSERKLKREI